MFVWEPDAPIRVYDTMPRDTPCSPFSSARHKIPLMLCAAIGVPPAARAKSPYVVTRPKGMLLASSTTRSEKLLPTISITYDAADENAAR